jgi:protease-4
MRGKNSGIFRETEKWTPDERAKMEEQANSIYYGSFVPKVAKGRNKTDEEVNSMAQGRVWTGTQAKANGLIDDFGGLEKAIDIAKELAKLPADKDIRRVTLPVPKPFFERIFGSDESSETQEKLAQKALADSLPADIRRGLQYAELFDRMKHGETMMMLPYELEIK